MNWYKKANLSDIDIVDTKIQDKKLNYLSIGHEGEMGEEEDINYLWVFYDGRVLVEPEDWDTAVHDVAFPDLPLGNLYTGRFESGTGKLSILKPSRGASQFREPHKNVLLELYRTFPTIKQIYKF